MGRLQVKKLKITHLNSLSFLLSRMLVISITRGKMVGQVTKEMHERLNSIKTVTQDKVLTTESRAAILKPKKSYSISK